MRYTILAAGSCLVAWGCPAQSLGGPMMHMLISQSGQSLEFSFETALTEPLEMQRAGVSEFGGVASVLNGTGYNAQFGWLASGFFSLPSGSGVFVRELSATRGLSAYDAFSFEPIFGTGGSPATWQWSGAMTHNWYSASRQGAYSAFYEVYVGDGSGVALDGWSSTFVRLDWLFGAGAASIDARAISPGDARLVPSPASGVCVMGGLALARRRR